MLLKCVGQLILIRCDVPARTSMPVGGVVCCHSFAVPTTSLSLSPMADTVGLVASILQLVDTALKVGEFIQDVRDAPQAQQKLLAEMAALRPLLMELQTRIAGNPSNSNLPQMDTTLTTFKATMEHFAETLRPADGRLTQVGKRLMWPIRDKKKAQEYLDKFEQFKTLLSSWLTLDIWDAAQEQRREHGAILKAVADSDNQQRRANEHLLKAVDDVASQQERSHDRILNSVNNAAYDQQQHINSEQRAKIIAWLSPLNFFLRQAEITRVRQAGTGGWFLGHQRFQEWEASAGGTLWCRGIPGAGKTVLASVVVDHLRAKSGDHNLGVASIYLNHKEAESPAHLLASVWRQLVLGKSIGSAAQSAYDQHSEKGTKPSLEEIYQILRSAMTEWSKVYIVVDALDEYPEEERYILLGYLAVMGPTVNLMLTSRPNISLHNSLANLQVIEIRANEVDIQSYLDEQIRISPRLSLHVNARPVLRHEIVSGIIDKADGMFLLAKLHIESLRKKPTIGELQEALQNLPADLEKTYDDAMKRIEDQHDEDAKIAHSVLIWVANTKRLLKIRELQEVLAMKPGANQFHPDYLLDVEIILSVCTGLVIVEEHTSLVRLVHYTTQHYLDRRFPDAHTHIARTLLTALASDGSQIPVLRGDYCQYALVHVVGQPEADLSEMLAKFLGQASNFQGVWSNSEIPPWDYSPWPADASPLWVAAAANLLKTATHLIDSIPGNSQAEVHCAALHVATFYGHLEMVRFLIEKGADVNDISMGV
ncbi:hypothetical protein FB451DRAFT_50793 [Mycena latifolia]|nr:hypothetical protein FB451DRAFT_50793 [Mycena latifolia]